MSRHACRLWSTLHACAVSDTIGRPAHALRRTHSRRQWVRDSDSARYGGEVPGVCPARRRHNVARHPRAASFAGRMIFKIDRQRAVVDANSAGSDDRNRSRGIASMAAVRAITTPRVWSLKCAAQRLHCRQHMMIGDSRTKLEDVLNILQSTGSGDVTFRKWVILTATSNDRWDDELAPTQPM